MAAKFTITLFSISLLFSVLSSAKNVVPFWKEDFRQNQFPSGWLIHDTSNEPVLWQHCSAYNQSPLIELTEIELFPDEYFKSASMENGFAYLYPFNKGAAQESHVSSLETNIIDCTGKPQVFLTFNTFIMAKYSDPMESAIIEVRNGDSPIWTSFTAFPKLSQNLVEPHPYFPNEPRIQSMNGQYICVDISSVAANKNKVYVRWTWKWTGAEEYCWLIDDVELLDENPLDINAVWGSLPGEGDFSNGLNGWTAPNIFGCNWEWSADALIDYPDLNEEADGYGCSCTVENGVAMINATCNPNSSLNYFAQLISPKINLSNLPMDKRLGLRFHESGSIGNNSPSSSLPLTSLMISNDGGLTFIDTFFLNLTEPFNKPFCKTTLIPMPLEIKDASEFVFKFVFSGSSFYWMIDDVRVVEMFDNDLRISSDYFAVAQNYSTPASLSQPIAFAAEVQNIGNLPQDFTTLFVDVINDNSQTTVFQDTLFLGVLEPGGISPDTLFSKKFTPAANERYTSFYTVIGDEDEESQTDNKVSFRFNTLGNTYSKSIDRYAINGGFAVEAFNPRYEIGNCYYIPPGANVSATSMEFAVAAGSLYADGLLSVDINLYQWKNGNNSGDVNGDFSANQNEYEIVANTKFTFDVAYSILDVIDVPFFAPVKLEDDSYYFVTIDYNTPIIVNGQQFPFYIAASEQINYASMFDQSVICGKPTYTSMLRKFGETAFKANAWGLLRTPFINLKIETTTPAIETGNSELPIKLFPNPNNGQFQIEILDGAIGKGMTVEIFDICGQLALPRQNVEGYVSQLPIDASKLSNGIYNLRVVSENKVWVHKFVVETTN